MPCQNGLPAAGQRSEVPTWLALPMATSFASVGVALPPLCHLCFIICIGGTTHC